MNFESFEHALAVCMTAENGSEDMDAALMYCLENAPPDLEAMLREKYRQYREAKDKSGCNGGCNN